ncbi:hypothetical protein C8R45DRAFT_1176617 [Mycena sanguinolenta]|nr:hypothetical protein C8R45DRAFT_1176617 [Mycena sanguinolenta]
MFGSGVRTPENAEPNLPNLNLRFRFGFREIAEPNRSSGSAFGKKYPEPEPNRTLPSLGSRVGSNPTGPDLTQRLYTREEIEGAGVEKKTSEKTLDIHGSTHQTRRPRSAFTVRVLHSQLAADVFRREGQEWGKRKRGEKEESLERREWRGKERKRTGRILPVIPLCMPSLTVPVSWLGNGRFLDTHLVESRLTVREERVARSGCCKEYGTSTPEGVPYAKPSPVPASKNANRIRYRGRAQEERKRTINTRSIHRRSIDSVQCSPSLSGYALKLELLSTKSWTIRLSYDPNPERRRRFHPEYRVDMGLHDTDSNTGQKTFVESYSRTTTEGEGKRLVAVHCPGDAGASC